VRTFNPTYRICQKTEMKRSLERTRHRWQENIKEIVHASLNWMHLAEDKE
jgi:hypothetical protein